MRRRWWWLWLAAFFLVGAAWALALPPNGTYDEKDHIVRAYAVATGHLTSTRTVLDRRRDLKPAFDVPATLLPSNATADCAWSPRPPRTPACQRWPAGTGEVLTPSGAARYSPVYYLPVGLPMVLAPDRTGLLLARLVSALLSAALLAFAVAAALRLGRALLVAGVVIAATPLTVNLFGAVNPNGLEISAGVLVFCALLALLRADDDRLDERGTRRLLVLAALGSLLLLTVRQFGPVWLALDTAACLLLARPGRVRALVRRRDARWLVGGAWVLGLAFAIGWLLYSGITDIATNTRDALHLSTGEALTRILTDRVPFYLQQVIGEFGYGETHLSRVAIAGWYLLAAALAVPCLARSPRRYALVLTGLGLASLAVLVVLELYFLPRVGWFSHGRYAMPSLVGVVLGGSAVGGFEALLAGRGVLRWYAAVLVGAAGLGHLYALSRVMSRYQVGIAAPLDPLRYAWRAPVGPVPPLLAMVAGAALLVALAIRVTPAHPTR